VGPVEQGVVFLLSPPPPHNRQYCHDYPDTKNVDMCHMTHLFGNEEQRVWGITKKNCKETIISSNNYWWSLGYNQIGMIYNYEKT